MISQIDENVVKNIPNLNSLILTNNKIINVNELSKLSGLLLLSIFFVIFLIPQLFI